MKRFPGSSIPLFLFCAALAVQVSAAGTPAQKEPATATKPAHPGQPAAAQSCDFFQKKVIAVDGNWVMPKNCQAVRARFEFRNSNSSLDCNGSTLSGMDAGQPFAALKQSYPEGKSPENAALLIHRRTCDGADCPPLQNITVRNCKITNYLNGAVIVESISEDTMKQLRNIFFAPGLSDEEKAKRITVIEDRLRAQAPQKILLENLDISNSHMHGMYVNRYVTGLTLKSSRIVNSGGVAIYLESGSRNNTIQDSYFSRNGTYDWDPEKRRREDRKSLNKSYREAIAVDSSAANRFIGNTFENNGGGGIALYKNCFEHAKEKPNELPRIQHSRDNEIKGNTFRNESVGVWIASRQSKDLSGFKCGDPVMHTKDKLIVDDKQYYRDYAERTSVIGNRFENVEQGIIVEDNGAQILDNTFTGTSKDDISVGTRIRSLKEDAPVAGTKVAGNSVRSIRQAYGQGDNVFENNKQPGGAAILAPCTAPVTFKAQDADGRYCLMEDPDSDRGKEYASGTTRKLKDETAEGNKEGAWGSGVFSCTNGTWRAQQATCCFGKSCKPGAD